MLDTADKRRQLEALLREAERADASSALPARTAAPSSPVRATEPMAIVGMAGRYPESDNLDEFWSNLLAQRNCIRELNGERAEDYARAGMPETAPASGRVRYFGLLRDIYRFDAPFFNLSRREAEVMDPHLRLLLQTVWACVENAGYRPRALDRQTGVFTSFYNHEYAALLDRLEIEPSSEPYLATAATGAIFANRISFLLGLQGPSEVYDTACSSALVALHRSVQAIAASECRQAIVAGVSLLLTPSRVGALAGLGILNEGGVCNPYSHPARREIIGEGVGALLIKPLSRAMADGDPVYATILGTDVAHHGDRSGSLTLPSAEVLAELMATTYRRLGLPPEVLRYIEGHGAGSEADVIELQGIQTFLERAGLRRGRVPVGSVKGNIGFGEASGGLAQLTKAALALRYGKIPPTLHFERVDPVFDLDRSRLTVATDTLPLAKPEEGCVSVLAYGLGGTYAHVVLGGFRPEPVSSPESISSWPIPLSANSPETLADFVRQLATHLRDDAVLEQYRAACGSEAALVRGVALTLIRRERRAAHRVVFLADSVLALDEGCAAFLAGAEHPAILRPNASGPASTSDPKRRAALRWLAGNDDAFDFPVASESYRRLPLPCAPFGGEVYRLPLRRSAPQAGSDAWEDRWTLTRSGSDTVIELSLSPEDPFIAQHRVNDVPTVPGAAYVALLARLTRSVFGVEVCTIENLVWTAPFEVRSDRANLRCEVRAPGGFRILDQETGRLCAKGRLRLEQTPLPAMPPALVDAMALERWTPIASAAEYWTRANAPATRQYHGPDLRRIQRLYARDNTMVAQLEPSATAPWLTEVALLDSALGACRGFSLAARQEAGAVVPFAVERIHLFRPLPTDQRLFVAVRERHDTLGRFDLTIEDGAGTVYTEWRGYYAKPVGAEARRASELVPSPSVPLPVERLGEPARTRFEALVQQRIAEFLKCAPASVPLEGSLTPLGLDSIGINALTDQLGRELNLDLPATVFFEYPSIRALSAHLLQEYPRELAAFNVSPDDAANRLEAPAPSTGATEPTSTPRDEGVRGGTPQATDIAVVGIGGLFPGANDARELWEKLRRGEDLISEMPEPRRRSVYRLYAKELGELRGIHGGFVQEADRFDAGFFGLSEAEVLAMDPQQRLFLEASWAAIEDAGYYPLSFLGRKVGVYVGAIVNDYSAYLHDAHCAISMFHEGTGSSLAGIANRVSYFLNLTGPSQAVDTACCSSLYAVDRAVRDLLAGACDAALAGGVSFVCTAAGFGMYAAMNYLAKDWRCKAFAGGGDGWSKAELFAAVLLKRYEDALRDGDPIYAVIKATGTNHGGKGYFYTQPNGLRHVELIREVYRRAQVDPRAIVHLEAHGSGTELGDALEFNSLSRALREYAEERGVSLAPHSCGLGSIKSNFGHAEAGAGIAGFIKTALLLHHGSLPPTLHLETPNPHLRLDRSPLFLVREETRLRPLDPSEPSEPRCAAVHSFNFSGAAAHALLAEHRDRTRSDGRPNTLGLTRYPVCFSAKTPQALRAYGRALAQFLRQTAETPGWLDRLVYTINGSRSYLPCRRAVVCESLADLIAQLESDSPAAPREAAAQTGVKPPAPVGEPSLSDDRVDELVNRWLAEPGFDWSILLEPFGLERLHLPTYPFEHERSYFPESGVSVSTVDTGPTVVVAAAPAQPLLQRPLPTPEVASADAPEAGVKGILAKVLALPPEAIDLDRPVSEYGFDSLKIVALSDALNRQFGLNTSPPDLFEFSTPREMVAFVQRAAPARVVADPAPTPELETATGIAIIGMSGQFPGAADLPGFWANLVAGKDAISEIPPDRWDWRALLGDPRREAHKTNVRWGGFIDDVTVFDPLFFRISPREAEAMDPHQRLLMMYVWRAIEDAGYRPSSLAGTQTGLFIATGSTAYAARLADAADSGEGFGATGAIPSIGPNRMSHFLDLRGPSEPIETSCSSSLVALHRAAQAIRAGECELAIAGGINTLVSPEEHIGFSQAGMLCEDGRCKTFSADANGYVRGEGVGMLVLKPLAAAVAAGDHIYGVIRDSAVQHGGRSNSLTAPNPKSQADLIRSVYLKTGIDPRTVGYIEAHGTGTPLGDPIEINGLKLAFRALYEATGSPEVGEAHCALASVKTHIGHLELAAGVAGVIKVLLQLRHSTLVRGLHCERVNPYIQLEGTPFYLLRENRPWPRARDARGQPLPRRAGVSSFGFGGVNAHVVIEEYVPESGEPATSVSSQAPRLVVLSARHQDRLRERVANLADFLAHEPDTDLDGLAFTLQCGREEMEWRLAVVVQTIADLQVQLRAVLDNRAGSELYMGTALRSQPTPAASPPEPGAALAQWGAYWVNGGSVDWSRFWKTPRRLSLPTYPFARERCWIPAPTAATQPGLAPVAARPSEPMRAEASNDAVFVPRWADDGPWGQQLPVPLPKTVWVVHAHASSSLPTAVLAHCRRRFPQAQVVEIRVVTGTQPTADGQRECDASDPRGFDTALLGLESADCVLFLAGLTPLDEGFPNRDELQFLRLVQSIKRRWPGGDGTDLFVITVDSLPVADTAANPAGAGLTGLAYSLAQSDHRFRVRNLDLCTADVLSVTHETGLLDALLAEPASPRGEWVKLRAGRRYCQTLLPLDWPVTESNGFRPNGVYAILGGAGEVGSAITRELVQRYGAQVIWLGRRASEHPEVQARIESCRACVPPPRYLQADALDAESLRAAVARIRQDHGPIHGAIFAGAVFSFHNGLAQTSEAEFTEILAIKTRGSVNFFRAFEREPLDFLCFFSSAQAFSFSGAASLSAYAAGIAFTDAFARSLWKCAPFPVGTIDWGFWESDRSGPAAAQHTGFLDARTGVEALSRFVGLLRERTLHQMLCLRTTPAVRELMPIADGRLVLAPQTVASTPIDGSVSLGSKAPPLTEPPGADEFEDWMSRLLFVQLRELSLLERDSSAVPAGLQKWLVHSRRLLAEKRAVVDESRSATEVWSAWGVRQPILRQEAQLAPQIDLVEDCLRRLPQILRGEVRPTEVLFPGASLERVERVYTGNNQFAYFSGMVAESVRDFLAHQRTLDPHYRARILEVGAGTGGTTSVILNRLGELEACVEEYCYTDVSQAFLNHGRNRFERPFLRFRTLDIEQAIESGDFAPGSYDLVIAANVLHATRDIRRTIRHAKAVLKRNGLLLLDELAGSSLFAHLTFGLLPGWWLFEDASLRLPGSPGLAPDTWLRVLGEEGFRAVAFPAREAHRFGQQIIVAESDGWIRRDSPASAEEPQEEAESGSSTPALPPLATVTREALQRQIAGILADFLKIPVAKLAEDVPVSEYGVDSILGIGFVERLGTALGLSLNSAILFEHSTLRRLSAFLAEAHGARLRLEKPEPAPQPTPPRVTESVAVSTRPDSPGAGREIAIIGMAGQFPGAQDVETLWRNLIAGKDGVGELPMEYWDPSRGSPLRTHAGKRVRPQGGVLEDRACFDPFFFNISPREAESMNPHQRLILQESWKALEDAGIDPKGLAGQAVGLFIGAEPSGYEHDSFTGASDAIIASRLSYFLDLKGPALVVNTGCSSSATAIHLACESLRLGESNLALAGGVFAVLSQELLARLAAMDMLSASGRCRSFDAEADGTVFSEGVGVVALKRYADALADGDPIYGVIEASGMNQDGASNGITAPNGKAQEALVVDLYRRCRIDPERIGYLECHGTGTRLGDPVEANALARAFRQFTERRSFCVVGSVKASLGHASAAAGVLSLIKVLLMMRHGQVPVMPHFQTLNPLIEFNDSAFRINRTAEDWPAGANGVRVAALNSFGHSGTNVHWVVRSEPAAPSTPESPGPRVVVLSARDPDRLQESVRRLAGYVRERLEVDFRALAYTLQVGREGMKHRMALLTNDAAELLGKLEAWLAGADTVENCWCGAADTGNRALQLLHGEEDSGPLLARWIQQGRLAAVAELWTLGAKIDWRLLYPEGRPARLRLPTYPFARERYWATSSSASSPTPAHTASGLEKSPVLRFTEAWEQATDATPTPAADGPPVRRLVCLLSDASNQASVRRTLAALSPQTEVAFLSRTDVSEDLSVEALGRALAALGPMDAVWCLWAAEESRPRTDAAAPIAILQALVAARVKPRRVLLGGVFENGVERCHLESWIGLERSVGLVLPDIQLSVLLAEGTPTRPADLEALTRSGWRILRAAHPESLLLADGGERVLRVRPADDRPAPPLCLDDKTVVITGGCGGLGLAVARRFTAKWRVNLVLLGRSPRSSTIESRLVTLGPRGRSALYCQADVCDPGALKSALAIARARFGPIQGVIHAAGVRDTRTLFEKSVDEARGVQAPKVEGTLVLDEALAEDPLEFVCYFSSSAAALGDFGAGDYAMANRFQIAHAAHRNALVAHGKRQGHTQAICWTLWNDTGMSRDTAEDAAVFLKSSGQRALEVEEALDCLESLLACPGTPHLVLAGEEARIRRILGCEGELGVPVAEVSASEAPPASSASRALDEPGLLEDLRGQLSALFKLPLARIADQQNFADFGIDSIGLAEFASLLANRYRIELTPSVFFGHSTLLSLATYLWEKHGAALLALRPPAAQATSASVQAPSTLATDTRSTPTLDETGPRPQAPDATAIIGMSGRFPGARDVEELWRILANGQDVVVPIPEERNRGVTAASTPPANAGGPPAHGPRCGWIPGVREFDPAFFEISPAEAEEMDPRQRLLLQEGWNALEDAGLGPEQLRRRRVGIFVGVEEGDYARRAVGGSITANHTGILAARLAYFLDLRGPALAINTSCSSSLVALHQACQSLRQGDCDVALVAGVNLLLNPDNLAALAEAGMLSPDGACYAFDRRANGMTPGEAVAAVVLAPLRCALAEGDPIDAVILATGINYDGKSNGITAPNGVAQAELVRGVHAKAGVAPEHIEYIVTHGTGTRLGDPVEVNALADAFGSCPPGTRCALTSCKPNLGHTFAASGLVNLVALVQALRHQIIPASLHFEERNEFIPWDGIPFYVNRQNQPWPMVEGRPRLGAVSAFGMSGTNAHAVVSDPPALPAPPSPPERDYLLVWSAKTAEALRERLRRFAEQIRQGALRDEQLADISHTLLTGRHRFPHRCALVVRHLADAAEAIDATTPHPKISLLQGVVSSCPGNARKERIAGTQEPATSGVPGVTSVERLRTLAAQWCEGIDLDDASLNGSPSPRRIHLPTYPFARREFWLEPEPTPRRDTRTPVPTLVTCAYPVAAPADPFAPLFTNRNREVDRHLRTLLAATLDALGLSEPDRTLASIAGPDTATPHLEKWLAESRRLLAESAGAAPGTPSLASAWEDWERAKGQWLADATLKAELALLEICLRALPQILKGERRPVDVLFPESSTAWVEAVYRGHPVADLFNRLVAEAVVAVVRDRLGRAPGRRVRILEIGAGTGGTTAVVLEALEPFRDRVEEYAYTDLSKAFLLHAEERFVPRYPYVKPKRFDVSRAPAAQQIPTGVYDVAIAANVLHATPDIRAAIRHTVAVLAGDGALILNELSANGWFTHLTFGLLEGWWLYQDDELRLPGCPGLAPDTWTRVLQQEGFATVRFPALSGHELGQQIVVAERVSAVLSPVPQSAEPIAAPESEAAAPRRSAEAVHPSADEPVPRKAAVEYFTSAVAAALKMDAGEIDPSTPLESYGLDSLMIGKVVARLREAFTDVPSSLLFETRTVHELADHFLTHRRAETLSRLGIGVTAPPTPPPAPPRPKALPAVPSATAAVGRVSPVQAGREPIAIIGMCGRFPSAPDLAAFWENLSAGKDCIVEIPPDRWSLEGFYEPDVETAIDGGKSYCKWGGFLEGFADFDPLFFNLSPRLALEMDPQERIFVQAAWEVIEDAGYTRATLAERYQGRVGVFAGVAHTEFNVLGPDLWREGKQLYPRTSFGSVANRVSYLLDLHGPSVPVDTMCSSALTAIHLACESILRGECAVALAGASNLCLHPSTYVSLCASRLLSKGARCHSFGVGDDGYVPAEGVGVVFLKRLSEALRDRDHIHAVLRGTAVNHGGRTNGYTVPNPNAQARVIRQALDNAGLNARAVTYVETHGAGTKLGDPIEVVGLTRAFCQDTSDTGFCAIGSVKSNVGHVEAAAGMAGLAKVVLQLQHGQLVPSLHSATLNPEIRFQETPFHVQQRLETWERPVLAADGPPTPHPRIAGISAFGAGGSNAHLIVEEHIDTRSAGEGARGPALVVLSARNEARLKEAAERLFRFVSQRPDLDLADIAYTLQVGREAMEERLAFPAASLSDLANRLEAFMAGKSDAVLRGQCRPGRKAAERFLGDADWNALLDKWIAAGESDKILEGWVRGYRVDWHRLYPSTPPRRIVLPAYPFAKERYWFTEPAAAKAPEPATAATTTRNEAGETWLSFREKWVDRPLREAPEGRERLAALAGRRLAVVGADSTEAHAFASLLEKLQQQSGPAPSIRVSVFEPNSEFQVDEPPQVVLFLGPALTERDTREPAEADLANVFHLSQRLMQAWSDEPIAVYYLFESDERAPRLDCEALSGFLRAAMKENEQHTWTLIGDYRSSPNPDRPRRIVEEWLLGSSAGAEVRYVSDRRQVRTLAETDLPRRDALPFRRQGVYLLAGGLGYVGRQLSLELARCYQATLVFLTRGPMDDSRREHCRTLESLGSKVLHATVDIADRAGLAAVYRDLVRPVGPVHGVFHLARHHEDQPIARKPWPSFARVLRPKVQGMLYLDELTRTEPLDFFAVFSSLGAYGVRGSSDYSYSTAFQNAFSTLRNRWVREGARSGPTVSLCWGPWVEDRLFPESRARLVEAGFELIDIAAGFPVLGAALQDERTPLALVKVRQGDRVRDLFGLAARNRPHASLATGGAADLQGWVADWERRRAQGEEVATAVAARLSSDELNALPEELVGRVYRLLFGTNGHGTPADMPAAPPAEAVAGPTAGADEIASIVRHSVAEVLHLSAVDDDRSFLDYGLDSIAGMQLAVRLGKRLKREVQPQSLVGFPTVAGLARHLAETPSPDTTD